jgi:DNA-binding transcriptional LysR family regulator
MDKWTELNTFTAVVEQESFAAAARALNVAPSGVSRVVANLEDRLGARLLHRTTRRLSLTEAGERFYAQGRKLLDDFEAAEADASGLEAAPKGTLRVSCVVTLAERWMPSIIASFMRAYPDVSVELIETDRPVDLIGDGIDVALVTGVLEDSSHVVRRLSGFHRLVVASPEYLDRNGRPETPEDLKHHDCLSFSTAPRLQKWPFTKHDGRSVAITVKGRFAATGAETILKAATEGLGIARLANFIVAPHLSSGELEEILGDFRSSDPVPLYVAYQSGILLSPKIRTFVDHLTDQFDPKPPWEKERAFEG